MPGRRVLGLRLAGALAVLVLTSCGGAADPVPGERAATLEVPSGRQQAWCAGAGAPVVLVNGIGDDATSGQWLEVERGLVDHARVCRYDRPGTGESPTPGAAGRGADDVVEELDAVVAHAGGDRPVVLVAHSFGGYLARLYAARYPDHVAALVLVDALDPSVGVVRGTGAATLDEVAMAHEQLDLADIEQAAGSVGHLDGDPPLFVLTRGTGVTEAWQTGQDRLAALSTRSQAVVVPGAGHQVPTEAPGAVVDAVEEALGAVGDGR